MARSQAHGLAAALARAFGGLLTLLGLPLVIGGGWLIALGGSPYYLLAGLGLITSGVLLAQLKAAGAWVYIAVFIATFFWALWEVGLNGWALTPRLVAPAVLLIGVILFLPVLMPGRGKRLSLVGGGAASSF